MGSGTLFAAVAAVGRWLWSDPVTRRTARIVGGPADGAEVTAGERFEWIEMIAVKRGVRSPRAGLYELQADGAYVFVGGVKELCRCGGTHPKGAACPLCGAETGRGDQA